MYCPVVIFKSNFGWDQKKAAQQWRLCVAHIIVLNQVSVYHERMYADKVISKHWLVMSSSSQKYYEVLANIASKNVTQVRSEEGKIRSIILEVNLNFAFSETLWLQ